MKTLMRFLMWMSVVVLAGLVILGAGYFLGRSTVKRPPAPTPVIRLEDVAELVCTRFHWADVIAHETGKYKGIVLVKGDAELSIDMQRAVVVERDDAHRRAVIRLPAIRVQAARVDHNRSRIWDIERNSWNPFMPGTPQEFIDSAYQEAQHRIIQSAHAADVLAHARLSAEKVLTAYMKQFGYETVIQWQ